MGLRKIPILNGEFYHIYNRGNSRQKIFFDEEDYQHFIKLLFICNSIKQVSFRDDIIEKKIDAWDFDRGETIVSIGAWVLMPNHFHIFMTSNKSPEESLRGESNITIFMRKFCTAYSKYVNTKYKRTGSLFEGKFQAVHVVSDAQAKYLFAYVHLNPVKLLQKDWKENGISNKKRALLFLEKYKWSSYLDHLSLARLESRLLDRENFISCSTNEKDFKKEIFEWFELYPEESLRGNFDLKKY